MGGPSYLFTAEEVSGILAIEARRRLGLTISGYVQVHMEAKSNNEDGLVSVRVTILPAKEAAK
jgi:hypothetical protein